MNLIPPRWRQPRDEMEPPHRRLPAPTGRVWWVLATELGGVIDTYPTERAAETARMLRGAGVTYAVTVQEDE